MIDVKRVKGSEKLTGAFGGWPSFHDSEVLTFTLDRSGPSIRAQIQVFGSEADSNRSPVDENSSVVTLVFHNIEDYSADGFNNQNVLFDLLIENVSDGESTSFPFKVTFDGIHGLDAHLFCRTVEIESVANWEPK